MTNDSDRQQKCAPAPIAPHRPGSTLVTSVDRVLVPLTTCIVAVAFVVPSGHLHRALLLSPRSATFSHAVATGGGLKRAMARAREHRVDASDSSRGGSGAGGRCRLYGRFYDRRSPRAADRSRAGGRLETLRMEPAAYRRRSLSRSRRPLPSALWEMAKAVSASAAAASTTAGGHHASLLAAGAVADWQPREERRTCMENTIRSGVCGAHRPLWGGGGGRSSGRLCHRCWSTSGYRVFSTASPPLAEQQPSARQWWPMAVASACVLALSHAQSVMADEFGTGMKRKTLRLLVPPDNNSSCCYLAPPRVRRRPRPCG